MVGNSVDRFNGLVSSLAIKSPCVVASDVNLVLDGVQTVNGVAVVSGDRVLVKDQTNPVENGIYDVTSSTWNRSADFDGNRDVTLNTIVLAGVNASEPVVYRVTSALPIIIGTTAVNWAQGIRGAGTINVVEDLTPQLGGDLDSNTFDIVLTSAGGGSYTVTADDAYGTFSVEAATPSLGQYGIKLDLGGNAYIGGATQWGGGSETIAGAKPVEGDLFYNQFLLETSDILSDLAVFGLNGTQAVEVGSYVQGGEVVLRTTGTGGFEDYEWSFVVDAGTQAVWIQDGYSFRIGNASGGVVTRPTIYVDFAHDGTDLNIAGVNTTGINITGVASIDVGASAINNVDSLRITESTVPLGYTVSADAGSRGLRFVGDDPWNTEWYAIFDCGYGVAIVANANGSTMAGAVPTVGDTLYATLDIWAPANDLYAAQFGFNGEDSLQVGNWVVDGDIYFYITRAGNLHEYSLWLDAVNQAVTVQDWSFRISNGGNYIARGTEYVDFEHDGTDFNITGTNTTDINITGVTTVNIGGEGVLTTVTSTTVALAAVGNAINTSARKEAGFMVFNTTTNKPVWAVGNADASVWVDATGATAHTPI